MNLKSLFRLIIWELEENWSFPILEIVISAAIFSILNQPITHLEFETRYRNLISNMGITHLILILIVGAVFSRSFAGSLSRGEIKTLLSYPIKRWILFLSKFYTNFIVIFAVYVAVFSLHIPLLALSPFEPIFYVLLTSLLLHLMLLCAVAIFLSLMIKNEIISFLASILLPLGLEVIAGNDKFLSFYGRFELFFNYFEQLTRGRLPEIAFQDVVLVISLPIFISVLLFTLSFIYFSNMQVD
ncbi:MAG: ABC transporter permease [Candidatus Bathyarchaeia archaeon]